MYGAQLQTCNLQHTVNVTKRKALPPPKPQLWSYTVGLKGYNRVKVYELTPGGPIYIQWWDASGRHRESLRNVAKQPVVDRKLAILIANRASVEQAKARERKNAGVLLGIGETKLLTDLLTELHNAKQAEWSDKYKRDQERMREFWLRALGDKAPLPIPPEAVERAVRIAAKAKRWSPRSQQAHLRYIIDAVSFAQLKLKWLTESDNLSAVSMPRVESTSRPYTQAEMKALLMHAASIDLRIAGVLHIAYDGARRANAIRTLRASAYNVREIDGVMRGVIAFGASTDKARRSGEVVLTESARAVIEALLQDKDVRATGWLFPGEKRKANTKRGPLTYKTLIGLLRDVEKAAGVEHIEGRGLHGVKRRAVTDARRVSDTRVVSKQSGTSEPTLRDRYDQDELEEKAKHADRLEELK
jgi:integrase